MSFLKTLLGTMALCAALLIGAGLIAGRDDPSAADPTATGLTAASVLASDGMAPDGNPGDLDHRIRGRLAGSTIGDAKPVG